MHVSVITSSETVSRIESKYYDLLTYIIESVGAFAMYDVINELKMSYDEYLHPEYMSLSRMQELICNMQEYINCKLIY